MDFYPDGALFRFKRADLTPSAETSVLAPNQAKRIRRTVASLGPICPHPHARPLPRPGATFKHTPRAPKEDARPYPREKVLLSLVANFRFYCGGPLPKFYDSAL